MFPFTRPLNIHPGVTCISPELSMGSTGFTYIASCGSNYDLDISSFVTAGNNLNYSFAYNTMPTGYSLNSSTGHLTGNFWCGWYGYYGDTVIVSNTCGSTGIVLDYSASCGGHPSMNVPGGSITKDVNTAFTIDLKDYTTGAVLCGCYSQWSNAGSLPDGVSLNVDTGVLSGTVTSVDNYDIYISATNSCSLDEVPSAYYFQLIIQDV